MTPKVDEDYKQARKNQIINAAGLCFAKKGFHNTTMKDIFDTSGLSSGAVYNYFESKEKIVETMADISFERNMKMISGAVEKDKESPLSGFLNNFFAMLKELTKQSDVRTSLSIDFYLWSEATRNEHIDKVSRECQENTVSQVAKLVEREQKHGVINKGLDSIAVARALLALLQGLQVQFVINPKLDVDAYINATDALLHGTFTPTLPISKQQKSGGRSTNN